MRVGPRWSILFAGAPIRFKVVHLQQNIHKRQDLFWCVFRFGALDSSGWYNSSHEIHETKHENTKKKNIGCYVDANRTLPRPPHKKSQIRKPSVCSAEVVDLFTNLRFALRLGSTALACSPTRHRAESQVPFASLHAMSRKEIGKCDSLLTNYFETYMGPRNRILHRGPTRKAKPCLAEVVRFASNPPPRRIARQSLAQLRASLSAHPAVTSRTPKNRREILSHSLKAKKTIIAPPLSPFW